jgi:hypothetical protein
MSAQQALEGAGIQLTKEHSDAFLAASSRVRDAAAAYDTAAEKLGRINNISAQLGSALSTAFADAIVEGKSLNDVLDSLAKTLEKDVINAGFNAIFSAPAAGGLSPFASLFAGIGHNAGGTDNWPGGLSWVGENGPEVVNLPRGAQVIPNDVLRQNGSGGVTVNLVEDSSRAGQVQNRDNGNGGVDISVFVDSITARNAMDPGSSTSFALNQRGRLASR